MRVKTNPEIRETMHCALTLTANARNGIEKFFQQERKFFATEKNFEVSIEKRNENRQGNLSFSIYFDNVNNETLATVLDGRVAVMECVIKNEGFLATGFHVRGKNEPVKTNRRHTVNLKFVLDTRTAAQMPIELYTALRELPIAEERSEYVEKRISSWEGYLRIQEMNANVEDLTTTFHSPRVSEDFQKLQITCQQLNSKKMRSIEGFSARIKGITGDVGNVIHVNPSKKQIEIELSNRIKNQARRQSFNIHHLEEITFSNAAELSQVRRLRKGFKDLQNGLAANANLEKVLFEERPVVRISNQKQNLDFHNQLNQFQQEAVFGAMNAHDLYVIQGPPGTGKTTVISEICYQNAKAGLRTLVASQANLAVDNALGRLLEDPDIRILRYGRTESIEEEGKKFIEENVAHYWKEQTIDSIEIQLKQHANQRQRLEKELQETKQHLIETQDELVMIEQKIQEKAQAKSEQHTLQKRLEQLMNQKEEVQYEWQKMNENKKKFQQEHQQVQKEQMRLEAEVETFTSLAEEKLAMNQVMSELELVKNTIRYQEAIQEERELEEALLEKQKEYEEIKAQFNQSHHFLEQSLFTLKLIEFKAMITKYKLRLTKETEEKIMQLESITFTIKQNKLLHTFDEWQALEMRIDKAIRLMERIFQQPGNSLQFTRPSFKQRILSLTDTHGFLDRLGEFIIRPQTKELLNTRHYSAERYETIERLAEAHYILKVQKDVIATHYKKHEESQQRIQQAKQLFDEIKKESIKTMNDMVNRQAERLTVIEEEKSVLTEKQKTVQTLQSSLQVDSVKVKQALPALQENVERLEHTVRVYEEKHQAHQQLTKTIEEYEQKNSRMQQSMEDASVVIKEKEEFIEELMEEIAQHEKKQAALKPILESEPEKEEQIISEQIVSDKSLIERNEKELAQLPMKEMLQKQWLLMLENATDYDLEEIKKLYIQHANVIGTTCVASARRDFMEEYPTFDVVIIDEVSKATPPELLLPMLKGKKIILVGDHHQLPPLIGQETMEEFLEESTSPKERKELESLLKESLFERLFRTLPKQNKTMLAIQYRMHEKIMQTITPFYNEGTYTLQCGLEDSDGMRNHLLSTTDFNESNHLLWFDLPNEPAYFEERVKGGTSRYNEAELAKIKSLLHEIDDSTAEAIRDGRLQNGERKNVGVISFYGEQVKRIDRLIEHELHLPNLHCRTGSVDKFQGMEMDIIILSFVRNHGHPGGDIGFAKDYRRLNVALSRAKELLIIVGSAEMFTTRPKHEKTRKMFQHLLEEVKQQDGYIKTVSEVR